ncbi:MAG: hypothetical protein LQ352_003418 [Teloschistes flavicans]|nr:MAG: hypothetical protein LQ352_003418 [Teloschistes flavicans]
MQLSFCLSHFFLEASNAFTSVNARRTFVRSVAPEPIPAPPAVPAPTTNTTDRGKREWPPSVRSYVQRSFAEENMLPRISRPEMETKLKQVISQSVEAGTLAHMDWDQLPLPQVMIQNEKEQIEYNTQISSSPSRPKGVSALTHQGTNEALSKKRKSSDLDAANGAAIQNSPWRSTDSRSAFESRISYPDKRLRNGAGPDHGSSKSTQILDGRKKRFEDTNTAPISMRPWRPSSINESSSEEPKGPIVGRCQDLEKKYFRLNGVPIPDNVRPVAVLEKTLEHLKTKWKQERNYFYICDQFKSLRQDLTVQHVKTGFSVTSYEIHARIALEQGDLSEYNQCQTQLRALYAQNLGGHPTEFLAYRILYFLHTSNRTDMNDLLANLTPAEKDDPVVRHALDTRSALALGNYHRFFQLYLDTPKMGAYLMDMFVGRERLSALSVICRSYKPDVKLRFVTEELGFESDDESARFVCDHGGHHYLEERDDGVRLLTGKALNFFETPLKAASAPKPVI